MPQYHLENQDRLKWPDGPLDPQWTKEALAEAIMLAIIRKRKRDQDLKDYDFDDKTKLVLYGKKVFSNKGFSNKVDINKTIKNEEVMSIEDIEND